MAARDRAPPLLRREPGPRSGRPATEGRAVDRFRSAALLHSTRAQQADRRIALEQVEQDPQRTAALAWSSGSRVQDQAGIVARRGQQLAVDRDVGQAELRQPALAGARAVRRRRAAAGPPRR